MPAWPPPSSLHPLEYHFRSGRIRDLLLRYALQLRRFGTGWRCSLPSRPRTVASFFPISLACHFSARFLEPQMAPAL